MLFGDASSPWRLSWRLFSPGLVSARMFLQPYHINVYSTFALLVQTTRAYCPGTGNCRPYGRRCMPAQASLRATRQNVPARWSNSRYARVSSDDRIVYLCLKAFTPARQVITIVQLMSGRHRHAAGQCLPHRSAPATMQTGSPHASRTVPSGQSDDLQPHYGTRDAIHSTQCAMVAFYCPSYSC